MKNPTYPAYPSNERFPSIEREAEVLSIEDNGFWIRGPEKNYFVSFETSPWFRYVNEADIHDVKLRSTDLGEEGGGWVHGFHWNRLNLDIGIEIFESEAQGEEICPLQRIITHSDRTGKIEDRKRDPANTKKEFVVFTKFTFVGSFDVTADNAEEARRIVEEQCRISCGGVEIDIFKAPVDSIEWDYTERPVKEITEVIAAEDFYKDSGPVYP